MNNHPNKTVRESWHEFAWGAKGGERKGVSGRFVLGKVGSKKPDRVEVFHDQRQIVVTDTTHRTGDPIHNFKTLFYNATVLEQATGFEVGSVDYRSIFRQRIIEPPPKPVPTP